MIICRFPEMLYFQEEDVRTKLTDILFCYARENEQLLYKQVYTHIMIVTNTATPQHNLSNWLSRILWCNFTKIIIYLSTLSSCFSRLHPSLSVSLQGMHELLAPIVFVLHCDHQAFQHASETANPRSDLFTTQARLSTVTRTSEDLLKLNYKLFREMFRFS